MSRDSLAMRLDLTGVLPEARPLPQDIDVRQGTQADIEGLATLSYNAYHDTVDDEGESPADHLTEISETWQGKYGELLTEATLVALAGGAIVSAAIVTRWKEQPLLAFALTDPEWQGRGLAGALILGSAKALAAQGETELMLAVTRTNPAVDLYQRLGFVEVPKPPG